MTDHAYSKKKKFFFVYLTEIIVFDKMYNNLNSDSCAKNVNFIFPVGHSWIP